jgi:hypothetical protein
MQSPHDLNATYHPERVKWAGDCMALSESSRSSLACKWKFQKSHSQ